MRRRRITDHGGSGLLAVTIVLAAMPSMAGERLLGSFEDGWQAHWDAKGFGASGNRFEVVLHGADPVLRIESSNKATALIRAHHVEPLESGTLTWRWKVQGSLTGNERELQKAGDDFAARVLVIFEKSILPWRHTAVCYVWAGKEAIGNMFPSPYSSRVATIVLQSGDDLAGTWITESRDVVGDYERFFGRSPKRLSGIAIMVDTDNTHTNASAWFDEIVFEDE